MMKHISHSFNTFPCWNLNNFPDFVFIQSFPDIQCWNDAVNSCRLITKVISTHFTQQNEHTLMESGCRTQFTYFFHNAETAVNPTILPVSLFHYHIFYIRHFVSTPLFSSVHVWKVFFIKSGQRGSIELKALSLHELRSTCNMFNWCYQHENMSQTDHVQNMVPESRTSFAMS